MASGPGCATIRSPRSPPREDHPLVNPFLALGQIIVSVALIVSILMQARGTGLSSTFGGDSAVYRSRRGIEKSLFRFTVILGVLFVLFSLVAFAFAPVAAKG